TVARWTSLSSSTGTPLSMLRRRPRGRLRMTRGRCGLLVLQRMKLSFTTPRRFRPAPKEKTDEPFRKQAPNHFVREVLLAGSWDDHCSGSCTPSRDTNQ